MWVPFPCRGPCSCKWVPLLREAANKIVKKKTEALQEDIHQISHFWIFRVCVSAAEQNPPPPWVPHPHGGGIISFRSHGTHPPWSNLNLLAHAHTNTPTQITSIIAERPHPVNYLILHIKISNICLQIYFVWVICVFEYDNGDCKNTQMRATNTSISSV